jgi:hypothetical protein
MLVLRSKLHIRSLIQFQETDGFNKIQLVTIYVDVSFLGQYFLIHLLNDFYIILPEFVRPIGEETSNLQVPKHKN